MCFLAPAQPYVQDMKGWSVSCATLNTDSVVMKSYRHVCTAAAQRLYGSSLTGPLSLCCRVRDKGEHMHRLLCLVFSQTWHRAHHVLFFHEVILCMQVNCSMISVWCFTCTICDALDSFNIFRITLHFLFASVHLRLQGRKKNVRLGWWFWLSRFRQKHVPSCTLFYFIFLI